MENEKGKKLLPANYLSKSDKFLNNFFMQSKHGYSSLFAKTNDIPGYTITILGWLVRQVVKFKNFFVSRIVKIFRLHNVKDIKKDRGSASLFLRNMSEDSPILDEHKEEEK